MIAGLDDRCPVILFGYHEGLVIPKDSGDASLVSPGPRDSRGGSQEPRDPLRISRGPRDTRGGAGAPEILLGYHDALVIPEKDHQPEPWLVVGYHEGLVIPEIDHRDVVNHVEYFKALVIT